MNMADDLKSNYRNLNYASNQDGLTYENKFPDLANHIEKSQAQHGTKSKPVHKIHPSSSAKQKDQVATRIKGTFTEITLEKESPNQKSLSNETDPIRYTIIESPDKRQEIKSFPPSMEVINMEMPLNINRIKEVKDNFSATSSPSPSSDDEICKHLDRKESEGDDDGFVKLNHGLEDVPSWSSTWGLGFQVYLMMVATSSYPLFIMKNICMGDDDSARASLLSTFVFVSGMITVIQTSFGSRLPIVQGGSSTFLIPTLAILSHEKWKCPDTLPQDPDQRTELWQLRMREIQGAIIVASIFQIIIGFTGVIGLILRFLTPITIGVSISMIGLSLFTIAGEPAGENWFISISTIILITLFSQYLRKVKIPIPFTRSPKREGFRRYQIFQNLPILLAMLVMWIICWILTLTNVLPEGDPARTDLTSKRLILENSLWFAVPYPFQWGTPTVTAGAVFGILAGVLSGIIESVGDYYATAKIVGARAPPLHAINRGIFIEGIGCVIAGIWGTGNGTTSYSENIGTIGVTQVGSRRVIQIGGLLMIIFSLFCKLNAVFVSIPIPIMAACLIVIFGTLTAAGLSNLKGVDLGSPRNMFVIGFSIFFSLTFSQWINRHSSQGFIKTGSENLDQMLTIFLSTGMFLGGFLAFILDNTIPGSLKERGLEEWEKHFQRTKPVPNHMGKVKEDAYDLPFIMNILHKYSVSKWIPISPTFDPTKYEILLMETFKLKHLRDAIFNKFSKLRHTKS